MKGTSYTARQPDETGFIHYSDEEHRIWGELLARQLTWIPGRACDQFLEGLEKLNLPADRIPQLVEVDRVLEQATGWRTAQVPALISFQHFFELLAQKRFPVATFIRRREEFDYLQEPDIFHEIFGHCPLLTNPAFAHFTHTYGKLGLAASPKERVFLARLYWFTVEFGLVNTEQGLRIYGGGILSSPGETRYALSDEPERVAMSVVDALRTPYRIDIMQPIYYVLSNLDDLFDIAELDLMSLVKQAQELGLHQPKFRPKQKVS
ncbi:phenylalanine 4-monooxygenase [Ferrimonas sediminicola]|uniref:Phenylalanine-4-hydroxylase n=1 Tax=Ferrimonas sediminicola TaxID=2569538 RepID=A0A4U1B8J8_9GAMM|nr:phenylalanine 4-monooxygenase [Ferrimonas sediminicola]TKB46847.1 phenylalanine 4-monooxygenase [Ferrimonas sediminicola]